MTTPARDTVRSNYRRMEAAVEPRADDIERYAIRAGRKPKVIPPRARHEVAHWMRRVHRQMREAGASHYTARTVAMRVRYAAEAATGEYLLRDVERADARNPAHR